MRKSSYYGLFMLLMISFGSTAFLQGQERKDFRNNWPSWRGYHNNGVAFEADPPIEFGENRNLKWKVQTPGLGHATPIIWGRQIIIQTAASTGQEPADGTEQESGRLGPPSNSTDYIHQFMVISYNKNTGKELWRTVVKEELPHERTHELGSWASNSPATDGKHIFAYFGSRGIFCLDMKGKIKWEKDFGQMEKVMSFGEGSSPAIYKDRLFIVWDHEGDDFIVALDKKTGDELWRVPRDEKSSWATPLVVETDQGIQVITSATNYVRSYDFHTGELIWKCTGLTRNVIPCPVYENGIVYVMSGFRGNAALAIDLSKAEGDITDSNAIVWSYDQNTPYTPNPVLMNGYLYFLRTNKGALSCLRASNAEEMYSAERLDDISSLFSSPLGAYNRIYIAAEGVVNVLKAGPVLEVLAVNKLDDTFEASPVAVGKDLFLRGMEYLYCFSKE